VLSKCTPTNVVEDGVSRYSFQLACEQDVRAVTLKDKIEGGFILDDVSLSEVYAGDEMLAGENYHFLAKDSQNGKRSASQMVLSIEDTKGNSQERSFKLL
jgi:hypothetical protein